MRSRSFWHQQALRATVAGFKPRLLVLDPLVRLHAIDANIAAEVAPLLGYLRSLQRHHRTPWQCAGSCLGPWS